MTAPSSQHVFLAAQMVCVVADIDRHILHKLHAFVADNMPKAQRLEHLMMTASVSQTLQEFRSSGMPETSIQELVELDELREDLKHFVVHLLRFSGLSFQGLVSRLRSVCSAVREANELSARLSPSLGDFQ